MTKKFISPTSKILSELVYLNEMNNQITKRYGMFSDFFQLLFYLNEMEFILQEKLYGYELRIGGKKFSIQKNKLKKEKSKIFKRKKRKAKELCDLKIGSNSDSFQKTYEKIIFDTNTKLNSTFSESLFSYGTIKYLLYKIW